MKKKRKNNTAKAKKERAGISRRTLIIIAAAVLILATLLTVLLLYLRPIRSIEITNGDVKYNASMGKYVTLSFDSNGVAQYQIDYTTAPRFLKSRDVRFEYDEGDGVTVDENGLVTFTSAPYGDGTLNSVKVRLVSKNGRGDAEDSIFIIARKQ
ncbi:MAG: hypothetical protein E7673_02430 [Ruminococcaceae bacterium]|nr:hypothetical protein [Oscillospiraceae bacterium]